MNGQFPYDVFLSYNRAQKEWTCELARRLKEDKFSVWLDEWELPKQAGGDWIDALAAGIEKSRKVVLVFSPEFFANNWPQFEASLIQRIDPIGREGRVVPILHTVCDVPAKWAFRQRIDFLGGALGTAKFEFAYHQLVYNLDSTRPYEQDLLSFSPEKLEFSHSIQRLGRRWRVLAWVYGSITALELLCCVIAGVVYSFIARPPAIPENFWVTTKLLIPADFVFFFISGVPFTLLFTCAAYGLLKRRPWGRAFAIFMGFWAIAIPFVGWPTLRILIPDRAGQLYQELSRRPRFRL